MSGDKRKNTNAPRPREVAGRLFVKLLTPLVTTAASAAAGYAARKAPELLEEHIAPRLRDAGGPRAVAGDAVPAGDKRGPGSSSSSNGHVAPPLNDDLARRRAERAERRNGRRQNRLRT
jgi:hypothetical protein